MSDPSLRAMMEPASIAVIGATERLQYGGRFVANLQAGGFTGRLYPVNPKRETVFGLPCYPNIGAVPEPVDLAAVIIPAEQVMDALEQCVAAGAKSAVVISAGFAELGTEGLEQQAALSNFARRTALRILGPNCLGLANVGASVWASGSTPLKEERRPRVGPIGLVSQSGASAFGPLLTAFVDRGIGLHSVVSTGNEADVDLVEVVDYFLEHPDIRAIAAFVEGIRRPEAFLACLDRALLLGKPIVLLKVGRSEVGQRAAVTHTGALTGSDAVQDAVFRQRGAVRVHEFDELAEVSRLMVGAPLASGDRVGVISHSGGITGLLGDKIGEQRLQVPPLAEPTIRRLSEILAGRGAATNPADVTGHFQRETFSEILDLIGRDENVDLLAIATAGNHVVAQRVIDAAAASGKPTAYVWTGSSYDQDGLAHLKANDFPVFAVPGKAARALRLHVDYSALRRRVEQSGLPWRLDDDALSPTVAAHLEVLAGRSDALAEVESFPLLADAELPVEQGVLAASEADAVSAAGELGYPVVVKAIARGLLHKSEAGAVRVGVKNETELRDAYRSVLVGARAYLPDAPVDGVLVQRMVAGIEVIAGISRDPQFGPVLLLGLGGVQAEALAATSLRLCPVDEHEASQMIGEVGGLDRLLAGFRGAPEADRTALTETLVRLSRLAWLGRDQIASIDLNPLMVLPKGQGVRIVDALIVPAESE